MLQVSLPETIFMSFPNITKRKLGLSAVVLIGVAGAMLATTQSAYLASLFVQGETESFRYTAQVEGANNLYVTVGDFFDTPEQLAKYRQANRRRIRELAERGMTDIPVQITFNHPLPQAEARTLAAEVGLTVKDFVMVGRSEVSKQRGTHFTLGALDKAVRFHRDINPPDSPAGTDNLVLVGVMVINGTVADSAGLERLEADNRIYLVDTTEVQVRELLQKQHRAWLDGKTVVVAVPSPYWSLDW
ncbi:hypothetical protein FBQ82_14975 [Anaerolineae bacterium CFX7]|nr:hypothetical protein [Anaerolineae bacterium CFX7]